MVFPAYLLTKLGEDIRPEVTELSVDDLPPGEVLVAVEWSAINFKDAMTTRPGNRVARRFPLVPGVELAGSVIESGDPSLRPGQAVLVQGYDLGVAHHGGFAGCARVPAEWVVPLPDDVPPRAAAIIGIAGFTAVLSLHRLLVNGVTPDGGPVLVTGASGGVGSTTVALLAHHGFEVRGVALLGIDTVATPIEERRALWAAMATEFPMDRCEAMVNKEIGLGELTDALTLVLDGAVRGRILVDPGRETGR
jgi:NADPH:quinone reductase-like Zn-dependent oxidoreductase